MTKRREGRFPFIATTTLSIVGGGDKVDYSRDDTSEHEGRHCHDVREEDHVLELDFRANSASTKGDHCKRGEWIGQRGKHERRGDGEADEVDGCVIHRVKRALGACGSDAAYDGWRRLI
jgi:hypothetical protein